MFWNRKKNGHGTLLRSLNSLCGFLLLFLCLACPALGQHYAYITNAGDFGDGINGDLSIIDLATNTVVATVPLGDYPQGVAVNPAGTAVYVGNTGSNDFTVIDTVTHTATTHPAGFAPCGVTVHPNGRFIYLANIDFLGQGASTVWVIDRATNTMIDEIICGNGSIAVVVHPNGKVAYVANVIDGTIAVFDTDTHEVIDTIVLEAVGAEEPISPVPIVVHPDGTYVYAANRAGPTLWAINTATHEFVARPFGNRHVGIGVNPVGTLLYLPSFEDADPNLPPQGKTIDVIDAKTLKLITTIEGFDAPLDVSVNPDGTRLYVTNMNANTVSVINAATYDFIATVPVGSRPHGYGECISSGVPRLLKADVVNRLEVVRETIEADVEGVFSPHRAIEHLETALISGNLCLQENLWDVAESGELDSRRLHASLGDTVFGSGQTMVEAILDTIQKGWIMNMEIRSELLAIVNEELQADRVLAAVAIDDAIVAQADPKKIEQAQALLENGDSLVTEAKVWELTDKKADLLTNAISEFQNAWQAAL